MNYIREASRVEKPLTDFCKAMLWRAWKFVTPGQRGVPDRMILKGLDQATQRMIRFTHGRWSEIDARNAVREILADVIEFVETKSPDGGLEPWQERRHKELRELGFTVSTVNSSKALERWANDRRT